MAGNPWLLNYVISTQLRHLYLFIITSLSFHSLTHPPNPCSEFPLHSWEILSSSRGRFPGRNVNWGYGTYPDISGVWGTTGGCTRFVDRRYYSEYLQMFHNCLLFQYACIFNCQRIKAIFISNYLSWV